jgi:predicted alpha/beta superfamily hydrolase
MKKILLGFLISCSLIVVKAQMKIEVTSVPSFYTPLLDNLYITGNFNSWDPADQNDVMSINSNGNYEVTINSTNGTQIDYKFTRGDWTSVETELDGTYLPNRSFTYSDGSTVSCQVLNWEDMLGWHTAAGNTHILDLDFNIPQLNRSRRIWIYLPQDYYTSSNKYPVVYMQDGQNLFDYVYSFGDEWEVDESMEDIQNNGGVPAIVVAVDNGGSYRIDEYSPWYNSNYGGGEGDLYADFLVNTLKPYVDANFRTLTTREYTAIFGSSMGGLISFYTAMKYQNIFGKAGIFSPSFWFSSDVFNYVQTVGKQYDMLFYFLVGGMETTTMQNDASTMIQTLMAEGYPFSDIAISMPANGTHSEWFWGQEYPNAFNWLFQGTVITGNKGKGLLAEEKLVNLKLTDENVNYVFSVEEELMQNYRLEIFNTLGQLQFSKGNLNTRELSIPILPQGNYVVRLMNDQKSYSQKIIIHK